MWRVSAVLERWVRKMSCARRQAKPHGPRTLAACPHVKHPCSKASSHPTTDARIRHFPGSSVLFWDRAAEPAGAKSADGSAPAPTNGLLLTADTIMVQPTQKGFTFMWSYPNMVSTVVGDTAPAVSYLSAPRLRTVGLGGDPKRSGGRETLVLGPYLSPCASGLGQARNTQHSSCGAV